MTLHTDPFRGDRFTIVTAHRPFGRSLNPGGRMLHRVKLAYAYWSPSGIDRFGASWHCDRNDRPLVPSCTNAALVGGPSGHPWCVNCDVDLPAVDRSRRLYVMRVGPSVKVGCTVHPRRRARQLRGELIATAPGGFDAERVMLARISRRVTPVTGREWFCADAEALCLAAMRAASECHLVKTAGAIRRVPVGAPGLPVPQRVAEAGGVPLHHAAPVVAPTPGRLSALVASGVGTRAAAVAPDSPAPALPGRPTP